MKLLDKISLVIAFNAILYFVLIVFSGYGLSFFAPAMFTDWGAIFFFAMVFFEISFLTL